MIIQVLMIIIGFILLIKGADFLVDGASNVAKKFRIPEVVIALTIVSIGTSLPELVVSLTSALDGYSDMAVGNIVGSNIVNLLFILGLCAVIKPLDIKKQTRLFEIPINLFATVLLFILGNSFIGNSVISRVEGIILLTFAVLFVLYNMYMAKHAKDIDKKAVEHVSHKEMKHINVYKSIFGIIGGIILLKVGGDFVIKYSVLIAKDFGLSEKLIGLTILAIATSLPELVTSVTAAIKGDSDIAIGNIIGSEIFNIFLILGTCATISPINYSISYNADMYLLMIGGLLLLLYPYTKFSKNKLTRFKGLIFITMYVFYMIVTII